MKHIYFLKLKLNMEETPNSNLLFTGFVALTFGFFAGYYSNKFLKDFEYDIFFDEIILPEKLPRELAMEIILFDHSKLRTDRDEFENDPMLRSKSPFTAPIEIKNPVEEMMENGTKLPIELLAGIFITALTRNDSGKIATLASELDDILGESGKVMTINKNGYKLCSKYNLFFGYEKISKRIYLNI